MAGTKRSKTNVSNRTAKVRKIDSGDLHPVNPNNKCKQNKTEPKKVKVKQQKTSARVVEDEQIFEIETQGQMSDFASENEQDFIEGEIEDTDSGKTIKAKPGVNSRVEFVH